MRTTSSPERRASSAVAVSVAVAAAKAVAVHPALWPAAIRQARRLARDRWWARPPFLPLPSRDYVGFRMQTQYGEPTHRLEPDDLIRYLGWCRSLDAIERTAAPRPTSHPPISRAPSGVAA
jgi:hypothetical protein